MTDEQILKILHDEDNKNLADLFRSALLLRRAYPIQKSLEINKNDPEAFGIVRIVLTAALFQVMKDDCDTSGRFYIDFVDEIMKEYGFKVFRCDCGFTKIETFTSRKISKILVYRQFLKRSGLYSSVNIIHDLKEVNGDTVFKCISKTQNIIGIRAEELKIIPNIEYDKSIPDVCKHCLERHKEIKLL